jgi:hypothetical protein
MATSVNERQQRAVNDSERQRTVGHSMISAGKRFDGIILLLLLAVEALLCYNFYSREIAWYPPSNFDQTSYLTWAYQIQQQVHASGIGELAREIFGKGHSTGLALPIEGALAGLAVGGARLPQLLVLFLTFCALQVAAFFTARAIWNSRASGYMLLGLILCEITPWYWSGGLFDFRMDFSAYCLYGIWVCLVIHSNLFLDRRWAIGCGLIGALLVLHRFLSLVYILGVAAGFAGFCLVIALLWRGNRDFAGRMWRRFYNLVLSVVTVVVIATPFLIRNGPWIYKYYIVPRNVVGSAKYVRALQEGITSLSEQLLFYPKSILWDHLGSTFLWAAVVAIGVILVARWLGRREGSRRTAPSGHEETFLLQVIFLLGTILCPLLVLINDTDKSPIVGGIIGVPVALLVTVLTARLAPVLGEGKSSPAGKLVFGCSLVIFVIGLANVFGNLSKHLPEYAQRRDLQRLDELDKWLVGYASDHHWSDPTISFDVLSPWLNAGGISASGFEQSGKLIVFHPALGDGIVRIERSEALSRLAKSDFLILTTQPKTEVSSDGLSLEASSAAIQKFPALRLHLFPFYENIAQYRDDLKTWADKNMILAKTVSFDNFAVTIYASERQRSSENANESP